MSESNLPENITEEPSPEEEELLAALMQHSVAKLSASKKISENIKGKLSDFPK